MGWTFPVGSISPERQKLLSAGEDALEQAVLRARSGARVGDIGAAIQKTLEEAGFGVIRDFVGYGIGRRLITEPQIPCVGIAGRGPKLSPPQVLHLHVIAAEKTWRVEILEDGWTAVTADGGASVLFTAMVNIEGDGTRMTFNPISSPGAE